MTDKELLELAAKAAGIYKDALDCEWYDPHGYVRPDWNPLHDDGDALRLAVNLGILSRHNNDHLNNLIEEEQRHNLRDAATRRAIVRAAAAIGEQMK